MLLQAVTLLLVVNMLWDEASVLSDTRSSDISSMHVLLLDKL